MGRTAIVTGGSRGIGRAICVRLAKAGVDVVLAYANGEEAAKETVALCEAEGVRALAVRANVASSEECEALVREAEAFAEGSVDILVNNAGITRDGLLMRMSDEDLARVLEVNLNGSFYMMRAVSKGMLRRRSGRIVNISSVVGLYGNAGQVNYAASKAAIIGMTKSLAKELASRKVTVNAVAPGMIATDMTDAIPAAAREQMLAHIGFGEMGTPEDIANAVAFLVSDEARYITGQVLEVSGGITL